MPKTREGIEMLQSIRLQPSRFALNLAVLIIVALWTLPTLGLLVTSLRDKNLIATSGWWTAVTPTERSAQGRTSDATTQVEKDGKFVITGKLFQGDGSVGAFGTRVAKPNEFAVGTTAKYDDGRTLTVNADGTYVYDSPVRFEGNGQRVFYMTTVPPKFTTENYENVLFSQGIGRSFVNSLTVTIPATIIPILIAAFAAYALAWMKIPGRGFIIAIIVGLLVVPLQMSLIPLLKIYNDTGFLSKTYLGIWLAHTGFGLPFAIYLLRSYIAGLPRDLIESAQVDGANDFKIFLRIILPLTFPALASFAIFQFLWVWNDLLVAIVFLGSGEDQLVLTGRLNALLGSRGGNWEILTASAFITIVVPLLVFFSLQRYFVRGLLAGSVKGG
jgi:alpha-glucoside transport system permease protein